MGFLSSLFGSKKKSQQIPISPLQNKRQKQTDRDLYFQLLDLLVPAVSAREELKKEMTKAFEQPASFYDAGGEYDLAIRGLWLSKDANATPKFVFIDTLIEQELMAEVDWKEEEEEVRRWMIAIMKAKGFSYVVSEEGKYENDSTGDVIALINEHELMPNGYSLQILNIQSDCYVFTVVPAKDSKAVAQMFAGL